MHLLTCIQEHTLTRERPNYIKAQESTRHVTTRLANAEVDVKALTVAHDAHSKYVWCDLVQRSKNCIYIHQTSNRAMVA